MKFPFNYAVKQVSTGIHIAQTIKLDHAHIICDERVDNDPDPNDYVVVDKDDNVIGED